MKKPLFSIVIPCYNVEKYLKIAIQSILLQPFENWEIILIDDGSTDLTRSIIKQYAEMDSRIYSYFQENKGVSEARNFGIKHASGMYIYFCDADDTISNNLLLYLANVLVKESPDLFVFGYRKVDSNYSILRERIPKQSRLYKGNIEIGQLFLFLEDNELFNPPWNKLYKLDLIIQNKLEFPPLSLGEDAVFNYSFFQNMNSIHLIAKSMYTYVSLRAGSATEHQSRFQPVVFDVLNKQKELTMHKLGLDTSIVYETDLISAAYDLLKKLLCHGDISQTKITKIRDLRKQIVSRYGFIGVMLRCSQKNSIKLFLLYNIHIFNFILKLQSAYINIRYKLKK